jgi:hypothetical protein
MVFVPRAAAVVPDVAAVQDADEPDAHHRYRYWDQADPG